MSSARDAGAHRLYNAERELRFWQRRAPRGEGRYRRGAAAIGRACDAASDILESVGFKPPAREPKFDWEHRQLPAEPARQAHVVCRKVEQLGRAVGHARREFKLNAENGIDAKIASTFDKVEKALGTAADALVLPGEARRA